MDAQWEGDVCKCPNCGEVIARKPSEESLREIAEFMAKWGFNAE